MNMSHGCVLWGAVVVYRTGDISWLIDKGSQWLHIWWSHGQRSISTWTLMVLSQWAAIPVWTHTDTHTGERTVGDPLHWGWQWNLALFLRDTSTWQTESLMVWTHWTTVLTGLLRQYCHVWKQSNIGCMHCWKMYLPVHSLYKKPGMGISFYCANSIVYTVGMYNPECTVIK